MNLKENKNIIYCSYDGITDPLGQSQILPYLYGLSSIQKYNYILISFEKSPYNDFLISKLKKHNIDWIPLKYTKYPPILSTLWDVYKLRRIINKLNDKGIDLIHCRSYITTLVALSLKKKYKTPFIFDMRGFYADERVDGKIWSLNNFIYKKIYNYFKFKEKEFLQYSDYTISLTKNGKKEILSWNLPNQSKIKVIPCCTDENLFQKKTIQNVRSELGFNEEDFIISYVGSIGTWYLLDEMLDFFKCLQLKKPNAKFFFITKDNPILILEKVKTKEIDLNKIKIQASSRDNMPSYIGISNFSIFFILPVFSKKASSPTKMGEIMSLGVPIICNSGVGDVDEIMRKCMPELLVNEFTIIEYQRVIDLIFNDYKPSQKSIIKTSHSYYSLEKGVEKYKEVYKKILGT